MKNTVLLIAFFYPPSRSSGVHRALAVSNFLVEQGHDVVVVTTSESFFELESGPADYSQMALIDPRITILRVPFSSRPIHQNLDLLSPSIVRVKPLLDRLLPGPFRGLLSRMMLRSGGSFHPAGLDERYRNWYGVAVDRILESGHADDLVGIIATGNPFTSFAIARTVSDLTGTPYIMDYRDPWKIDVRTSLAQLRSEETEQLEQDLVAGAAYVTLPNEHLAAEYRRFFSGAGEKVHVVENGFDRGALPDIDPTPDVSDDHGLAFGALGTVSDMWPLLEFGTAWREFHDTHPSARFELAGHLGWFNSGHNDLLARIEKLGAGASYAGPVPRSEVADFYGNLDVVVMFLWGDQGLTAGKMYEVAALGIPVICIQPRGGGVRTFLEREHPDSISCSPEPTEIVAALREIEDVVKRSTPERRQEIRDRFAQYERREMLRPLGDLVSSLKART